MINKINYELIDKIIDAILPLPAEFGADYDADDEEEEFYDIKQKVFEIDPSAYIHYGLTKLVIISPKIGDVVIKIPFNGMFNYDNGCGAVDWYNFNCARDKQEGSNYCEAEYLKYLELKKQQLDCFVAEVICYKPGIIYLQEYAVPETEDCEPRTPSKNSLKKATVLTNEFYLRRENKDWLATCLDIYGEEKVHEFLKYCHSKDSDIIEDLHSGNIGYRDDDTPCIIDYSNFLD